MERDVQMGQRVRQRGERELKCTSRDNPAMRFEVFLPPFAEFAEPRRVVALGTQTESAGWDGLFLWDHMLAFPGMAVADPWVVMAAVATVTQRIRLGALVTPLPRRRPWVLSRQMATLDRLSGGRLIGGVGLGDDGWSEFSSFGDAVDPVTRGAMLDEALELLQQFLNGEPVDYDGSHYSVHSPALLPTPLQRSLPLWGAVRWPNEKATGTHRQAARLLPDLPYPRRVAAAGSSGDQRTSCRAAGAWCRNGHRHRRALQSRC